jgi:hypothetical protein
MTGLPGWLPAPGRTAVMMASWRAGWSLGADSTDDMALLRRLAMDVLFGGPACCRRWAGSFSRAGMRQVPLGWQPGAVAGIPGHRSPRVSAGRLQASEY